MKKERSVLMFFKRNAVYLVLALCILAVGLSITFMLINKEGNLSLSGKDNAVISPNPDQSTGSTEDDNSQVQAPIVFIMPIESSTSIKDYTETMVYNSTLNRYTAHLAMDFFAPEGTNVFAVFDGTVLSVEKTFLQGTTITIDHGDGLHSVYNSLLDGDSVSIGQTVKKGDVIGQVSSTNRQEYKDGAHLHFEVRENGQSVDPIKYLDTQEK